MVKIVTLGILIGYNRHPRSTAV